MTSKRSRRGSMIPFLNRPKDGGHRRSKRLVAKARTIFMRRNADLPATKKAIAQFLSSKQAMLILLFPTLYLLFIDDLVAVSGAEKNDGFRSGIGTLKIITFFIFLSELVLSVYSRGRNYVYSALFALDVIALVSLLPDLWGIVSGDPISMSLNQLSIARVSRAARLATRVARMSKIIEMMNCAKLKKLDPHTTTTIEPSRVGYRLISRTTIKVIVMMLLLLLTVTLCTQGANPSPHAEAALKGLESVSSSAGANSTVFMSALQSYTDANEVMYLRIDGHVWVDEKNTRDHKQAIYLTTYTTSRSKVIFDEQSQQQVIYGLALLETCIIISLLCIGCVLITKDAMVLVIRPLEKMLGLIKKLTLAMVANPSSSNASNDDDSSDDSDSSDEQVVDVDDSEWKQSELYTFGANESEDVETEVLVEMMDKLAHNHIQSTIARRLEAHKRHATHTLEAAIVAFLARKEYSKINEKHVQRLNIAGEILSTEKSYVTQLSNLVTLFLNPLRSGKILNGEETEVIFSQIDVILMYNTDILAKFEERIGAWTVHTKLSDIFANMADMSNVYAGYINNFDHAMDVLTKCRERNSSFSTFLEEQTMNPLSSGLTISSYLIMPVQRLPRYVMLLEQLLKHTPTEHSDYEGLRAALEIIKDITNDVNERKRIADNQKAVQDIYLMLEPPVEELMNRKCEFILKGNVFFEGEECFAVLFSNVFILSVAKDNGERLSVRSMVHIKHASVASVADSAYFGLHHAFQVENSSSGNRMLFCCSFQSQKTSWVDALSTSINNRREKYRSRKGSIGSNSGGNKSKRHTKIY